MPPSYPAYGAAPGYSAAPQYAGFGSRLGATIIDGLLLALIGAPFSIAAWASLKHALRDCVSIEQFDGTKDIVCGPGGVDKPFVALAIALYAIGLVVGVVVYVRWIGKGQSPGLKAVGARVVDANTGAPIGTGRAVGRYFARILSALPCFLGFFWVLWDARKQTWHDKMVSSVVVKT